MDRLPAEILLRILSYLQPKLGPLLRVNKQWFYCGLSLVWRETFWSDLSRIPKDRRILYATAIRRLFLWETAREQVEEFSHFAYPRLNHLNIGSDPSAKVDIAWLKRYMHAELQSIEFSGDFDPELLLHLQTNCRQLRKISITAPGARLTPEIFLRFLQNTLVTEISFEGNNIGHLLDLDTLGHLVRRENLEELSLGCTIKKLPKDIKTWEHGRSFRKLCVKVTHDVLPSFISNFTSLHDLNLDVEGEQRSKPTSIDFNHLSALTQLRRLNICLNGVKDFDKGDLLFIKDLKHLRELGLTGTITVALTATGFNDLDFEELVATLPNLRVLTFHMYRLYLTTQTLAALGQFCPLLERCDLMGGFNMLQLRLYQTPLFPRLHSLCIRDFTSLVIDRTGMKAPTKLGFKSPKDHVKQLEEHFPKLQDLTLTYANDTRFSRLDEHEFSNSVLYKWRARQEERERCFLENYS